MRKAVVEAERSRTRRFLTLPGPSRKLALTYSASPIDKSTPSESRGRKAIEIRYDPANDVLYFDDDTRARFRLAFKTDSKGIRRAYLPNGELLDTGGQPVVWMSCVGLGFHPATYVGCQRSASQLDAIVRTFQLLTPIRSRA